MVEIIIYLLATTTVTLAVIDIKLFTKCDKKEIGKEYQIGTPKTWLNLYIS